MDRHKFVHCKFCGKGVRSNNLKRHELTHRDILMMTDDEIREELRARHVSQVYREEKRQRIEEIAQQEKYRSNFAFKHHRVH